MRQCSSTSEDSLQGLHLSLRLLPVAWGRLVATECRGLGSTLLPTSFLFSFVFVRAYGPTLCPSPQSQTQRGFFPTDSADSTPLWSPCFLGPLQTHAGSVSIRARAKADMLGHAEAHTHVHLQSTHTHSGTMHSAHHYGWVHTYSQRTQPTSPHLCTHTLVHGLSLGLALCNSRR